MTNMTRATVEIVVRGGGTRHGLYARAGTPFRFSFEYDEAETSPANAAFRAYIAQRWGGKKPRGVTVELLRFVEEGGR